MKKTMVLTIDGSRCEAPEGQKLLWAALDNDIFIPHLCAMRERAKPAASCRLCFVEIEGRTGPVTSCTEPVAEGMIVHTRTEAVIELVRAAFDLIMSAHPVNCGECPGNTRCALQEIAKKMKFELKSKRLKEILPDYRIDDSHPEFSFDPNRCVLCGRCVYVCNNEVNAEAIDYSFRGLKTRVEAFGGGPIAESRCISCLRCVEVCPVHAFYMKKDKPAL